MFLRNFNLLSSSRTIVKSIRPLNNTSPVLHNTTKTNTHFRKLADQGYNLSNLFKKILEEKNSPCLTHFDYQLNHNDLSDTDFILFIASLSDSHLNAILNILPKELRVEMLLFVDEISGKFAKSKIPLLKVLNAETANLLQQKLEEKELGKGKIETKKSNANLSTASFLNDKKTLPKEEEKINEEVDKELDDIKYTLTS